MGDLALRWLTLGSVMLCAAGAPGRTQLPGGDSPAPATLREDGRFQAPITVGPSTLPVGDLLFQVVKPLGIPAGDEPFGSGRPRAQATLIFAGKNQRLRVTASLRQVPLHYLLEGLEVVIGERWLADGSQWVLAPDRKQAQVLMMPLMEGIRYSSAPCAACKTLTQGQMTRLLATSKLTGRELSPQQRDGLAEKARRFALQGEDHVGPEALEPGAIELWLRRRPETNEPLDVMMAAPGHNGEIANFGTFDLPDIRVVPGPLPGGGRLTKAPAHPVDRAYPRRDDGEPAMIAGDPRLDKPVRFRIGMVYQAAAEVARVAGVSLLAHTWLDTVPQSRIRLPGENRTARDAMQEIENCTGGRWKKVGPLYVLKTDPTVERLARLSATAHAEWTQLALLRLRETLGGRVQVQLLEPKPVQAADLPDRARDALRWVVALRFAQPGGTTAGTLDLKGVELTRVGTKVGLGTQWDLWVWAQSTTGRKIIIGQIPLRRTTVRRALPHDQLIGAGGSPPSSRRVG